MSPVDELIYPVQRVQVDLLHDVPRFETLPQPVPKFSPHRLQEPLSVRLKQLRQRQLVPLAGPLD